MISNLIQRQKKDLIRDVSSLGSLFFYIFVLVLFLSFRNYSFFSKLLSGLAIIYIVTILFRTFYFKERPEKLPHKNYIESLDASSFPSLHAARTAFMAAVLIKFFNNKIISAMLILLALAVAYSRIYLKKHDIKDISAGIVLGILVYFLISLIIF